VVVCKRWGTKPNMPKGRPWRALLAKRKFGEDATAREPETITREAVQRAWAYEAFACYTRTRARKAEYEGNYAKVHYLGII